MATKNYPGWQEMKTFQFKEIISELMEAKEEALAKMIISESGLGKTNTVNLFRKAKPQHTYVITIGETYNLAVLLQEVMEALGIRVWYGKNSKHRCLRDISKKLIEISEAGGKPIIILDEAENSRLPMLKAYKQLYDYTKDHSALVLIGTDQLIAALNKRSTLQSIPQFRRRFKAGTRYVSGINKARDFKPFFDLYIKDNPDVQDLLLELCDNYGELHDYLDPVLRHCSKKNIEISAEEFRLYHKIPKQSIIKNFKRA